MFNKALLLALATVVSSVLAAPVAPEAPVNDATVAQFALTLEHLENSFYTEALNKFDDAAFQSAGFPSWVRGRFEQIRRHEATHVEFLQTVLGDAATKPCEYHFPYDDPKSFAALSSVLETVGASAYLGAAKLISDKDTLTAAASILTVESRQASWVMSSVLKQQPWDGSFETPITPSGAFSLAVGFIVKCPETNPQLPVQLFPTLTLSNTSPAAKSQVGVTFDKGGYTGPAYLAWLHGLDVAYSDINGNGQATVPEGLAGTVFAVVVKSKDEVPSDATALTGLAIVQLPFDSYSRFEG